MSCPRGIIRGSRLRLRVDRQHNEGSHKPTDMRMACPGDGGAAYYGLVRILRHPPLCPILTDGQARARSPCMKEITLSVPQFAMTIGTRAALGVGIGFLLGGRLNRDQRQGAGWALLTVGLLTTVPVIMSVIGGRGGDRPVSLAA